jgi:glycosyltransferase involved in cell wall biosynthesis
MFLGGLRKKGIKKYSQENKPLITIITVVRNGEKTLENTILSVIGQDYINLEYIIIDGLSNDGTLDIIKKYEDKIDYWISEPDKGIYDAMNKGINLATGEWILFLGSDDLLVVNFNEIVLYFKSDLIYYGNVLLMNSKKIIGGKYSAFKLVTRNIPHQAIFYPKKIFLRFKYDINYPVLADYYLNILCWHYFKFQYINIIISKFNEFGLSSYKNDKNFIQEKTKHFIKYLPIYLFPYIIIRYLLRKIKIGFFYNE